MKETQLTALSPLDGRYHSKLDALRATWSEQSLMQHRLLIEVHWLQLLSQQKILSEISPLTRTQTIQLNKLVEFFSAKDAKEIKQIETSIHHDVKAVELFLKKRCRFLKDQKEFFHFGCTSDDINNVAYALMIQTTLNKQLIPTLKSIIEILQKDAHEYANIPMLARTHGQPATPTTLGKELANFVNRLKHELQELLSLKISAKFNGATGSYNAHQFAYPSVNWEKISKEFISKLGLNWNNYTTQIEPHDYIVELSNIISHTNSILTDFATDIWHYISLNYLKQKKVEEHVGSSTMPHKINPIHFENAEGNFGLANALFNFFSQKLPISRLQRDLSDSTVMRNIGVAFGYTLLGFNSLLTGLETITPDTDFMIDEVNQHWELLAEPLQTLMRRYKIKQPYEQLKKLTRGNEITQETLHKFVDTLPLPPAEIQRFKKLTPATYLGIAVKLAKKV